MCAQTYKSHKTYGCCAPASGLKSISVRVSVLIHSSVRKINFSGEFHNNREEFYETETRYIDVTSMIHSEITTGVMSLFYAQYLLAILTKFQLVNKVDEVSKYNSSMTGILKQLT